MMRVSQLLGDAVIADRPAECEGHVAGATPPAAPGEPVLKLAEQLTERRSVAQSAHASEAAERDEEAPPTGAAQPSHRTSHGSERGAKKVQPRSRAGVCHRLACGRGDRR